MSKEEMKKVARGVHDALMRNDAEKLVSFFTKDASITDPAGTLRGHEGIKRWLKWHYTHLAKLTIKETGMIIEGNKVVHEYIGKGTTPDGLTMSLPGVAILEFKGGKVQRLRDYFDVLTIAKQMAKGWFVKKAVKKMDEEFRKGR